MGGKFVRRALAYLAVAALVALRVLSGFGPVSAIVAQTDVLIVPGERIGPIRLGMDLNEVLRILGWPDESRTSGTGEVLFIYAQLGLTVFSTPADPTPKVTIISARRGSRYVTDRGIKVGNTTLDVVRAYDEPDRYTDAPPQMIYEKLGIIFLWYSKNGKRILNEIEVMAPMRPENNVP